jgi:hypothetical protein
MTTSARWRSNKSWCFQVLEYSWILDGSAKTISTNNIARGMVRVHRIRFQPTKIRFRPPAPETFTVSIIALQPLNPVDLTHIHTILPTVEGGEAWH